MYGFCKEFHISPREYRNCLAEDIDVLLEIHGEVKTMELEEQKRLNANNRI